MNLVQVLWMVILLIVLYLISAVRSWRRLSHVPGPKIWGWSIIPLLKLHNTGTIYDKLGELGSKYGPLVRIGPNYLLASDPEIHRRMSAARSPYKRSRWYQSTRLTPGVDNVLSQLDENRHNDLRRRMAAGYAGKENPRLEADIDQCILDFVDLIERKYISNGGKRPMEFARKVQFFTSDVMSQLSFNSKFHDLRDDRDNYDYIREIETIYPNIFGLGVLPGLVDLLTASKIMDLMTMMQSRDIGLRRVQAITHEQVAARFGKDGEVKVEQLDMLGSFIRHGLSMEELEQESMLQLAAGSDTAATAIRATMLNILQSPRIYKKLMAEIDTAVDHGKISSDSTKIITDTEARTMPYLQAVIKEGLRWFPPIAGLLAKEVPPGGDTINGFFVPEGTNIAYNAFAIHHSPTLFGPDELSFRPERWIHKSQGGDESSWDRLTQIERNNELVFGYGKYQCLGKTVAFVELNKILVELLRRFNFTLLHPDNPWKTRNFGIHFQEGLWVTIQKRV